VRVALARSRDAARLRALHVRTWETAYPGLVPESFYHQRLAEHRIRDWDALIARQTALGGGVVVARDRSAIAGLCQYGPAEDDDDDARVVGHIRRLYVDPRWQRQGVGRALLADAMTRLEELGIAAVTLWVLERDTGARTFYERIGYRPDGGRRVVGAADVRYRRSIP
jgi:GNAT superfamily N-acetyltransferase